MQSCSNSYHLVIFTSVALTATLFIALVIGLTIAQISGDLSLAIRGFVLLHGCVQSRLVVLGYGLKECQQHLKRLQPFYSSLRNA